MQAIKKLQEKNIFKEDMRGYPVYLGLSMNEFGVISCKPQNLLVNLPILN